MVHSIVILHTNTTLAHTYSAQNFRCKATSILHVICVNFLQALKVHCMNEIMCKDLILFILLILMFKYKYLEANLLVRGDAKSL